VHTNRKQHRGDISRPPVDELTQVAGGQFQLVNVAAKRARQLTAFHAQLGEGLLAYIGPLVTPRAGEKPLSTALREVHWGLLEVSTPGAL
jgi:DNA-directed RNA polymerase subunit omega